MILSAALLFVFQTAMRQLQMHEQIRWQTKNGQASARHGCAFGRDRLDSPGQSTGILFAPPQTKCCLASKHPLACRYDFRCSLLSCREQTASFLPFLLCCGEKTGTKKHRLCAFQANALQGKPYRPLAESPALFRQIMCSPLKITAPSERETGGRGLKPAG